MTNQVQTVDFASMPLDQAIEAYTPNFEAALPANISVDHFKRMILTAISINPDLMNADRRTLFNSCVKCASDGLLPDGREAALVIYKTKVKDRQGREQWIEAVQFMPMIAGIRKRLRNSGEVDSATAEVVYRKDRFKYRLGDGAFIEHEPPPLDEDRGDAIGAYAIIKLASGETIREVMGIKEIEKARAVSRARDSAAGPWVKWWSEMARKTVMRRAAKAAPQASMLEKLLMRDEEIDALPAPEDLPAIPARPRRESFALPPQEYAEVPMIDPAALTYPVVDLDGVETEYMTPDLAEAALTAVFYEAAKRGVEALRGAAESNDFHEIMPLDFERRLIQTYETLLKGLQPSPDAERPGDDEDAFGLKPLPQDTKYLSAGEQRVMHEALRRSTTLVHEGEGQPNSPAAQPTEEEDTNGLGGPAAAGDTDLLGGSPAENLVVPLGPRPTPSDLDYFARQLLALIDQQPPTRPRLVNIRKANEAGLLRLKAGPVEMAPLYDEVQAALARKTSTA